MTSLLPEVKRIQTQS